MNAALPKIVAERDAIFPALAASLVGLFFVRVLTKRPSEAQLAPFAESA